MKFALSCLAVALAVGGFVSSLWLAPTAWADEEKKPAPVYSKDVAPFVQKYCVECHSGNRAKAGVKLDGGYDSLLKASRKGKSLVAAGKPDDSALLLCLSGSGFKTMPPRKQEAQPTKEEIARLKDWIAAGAKNDS